MYSSSGPAGTGKRVADPRTRHVDGRAATEPLLYTSDHTASGHESHSHEGVKHDRQGRHVSLGRAMRTSVARGTVA